MGVRFVVRSAGGARLSSEPELRFEQARIVIGRGAAADLCLPDTTVSESHATAQLDHDHWVLADNGSTNGTKCAGQRVRPDRPKRLRDGDLIEVGPYVLTFHLGAVVTEPASLERTAELARRLLRQSHDARGGKLAPPRLCVVSGETTGATLELLAGRPALLIGRAQTCALVLPDPEVSREHAEVVYDDAGVCVRSVGGKNGIVFGGQLVPSRRLRDGDEIVLGATRLLFEEPAQGLMDAQRAEPDEPYTPPPPVAPRTEPLAVPAPPAAAAARTAPAARLDAELMIYVLAAVVLAASVLGLVLLL